MWVVKVNEFIEFYQYLPCFDNANGHLDYICKTAHYYYYHYNRFTAPGLCLGLPR